MIPGLGRSAGEGIGYPLQLASLVAQLVKNPPAMWETWVQSLGWKDPWVGEGKGYPLQCSGLENSRDHSPWGLKESDTTEQLHFTLTLVFQSSPLPSTFILQQLGLF